MMPSGPTTAVSAACRFATRTALGLSLLAAVLPGCGTPPDRIKQLHNQVSELRNKNRRLEAQILAQDKQIEGLRTSVKELAELGETRIDKLYRARRLEVTRLSGGRDFDDTLGDDGLSIYLKLYDQDDHVIKAAGEIDIVVFDLEGPSAGAKIVDAHFNIDAAKDLWYGQLLTYHYRADVRWTRPPVGRSLTVHATFRDYLTGQSLQDTAQIEVTPPPQVPATEQADPAATTPNDR